MRIPTRAEILALAADASLNKRNVLKMPAYPNVAPVESTKSQNCEHGLGARRVSYGPVA